MKHAYVVDYAIRKPDGSVKLSTASFAATDIFSATGQAADMVEDYVTKFPDHEVRVWDIGLAADCTPEDLFEEE